MHKGRIEKLLTYYTPMPMCIVNSQGKVTRANKKIADVFKYDGIVDYDVFALTGIKMDRFIDAAVNETPLYIERNGRSFKISCSFLGSLVKCDKDEITDFDASKSYGTVDTESAIGARNAGGTEGVRVTRNVGNVEAADKPGELASNTSILMYFIEVSSYEKLKKLYNDERAYIVLVNIDNYDELIAGTSEQRAVEIAANIDKLIREWAKEMKAMVVRYRDNSYELVITHRNYENLIADKFSILNKAKEIETDLDFPVTFGIGIGMGAKNLAEAEEYAQEALDMALGRGGDQVVVKNVKSFEYYGGTSQSVEKGNKGKSRIIGHALKTLMTQSTRIFIMGHKNPDMDCFGAALGIHRLAQSTGKETYILLSEYNESMIDIIDDAKTTGEYSFISEERALSLVEPNSLVIVVDSHRPELLESAELMERVCRRVVIDHHRKAEDVIPNQTLSYMESYASSASELVTEMLEYVLEKKMLSKFEADALLAGIMLDTNRFAVKAGVRTFEVASWLKRAGADLTHVRRYFQDNSMNFRARAEGVANAKIHENGIATSICEGETINTQVTNSQVADELLTIKGIEASFVAGINEKGRTIVSARSLGNINVQYIMEHFGGGGHMNTAGTATDLSPSEILDQIVKFINRNKLCEAKQ